MSMTEHIDRVDGEVYKHMLGLARGALTHANWHANYFSPENAYWPELSVLQAAHACEIFIKARIAQEHPLLIFEHLPKALPNEAPLSLRQLVEGGRTFQYFELPDRLWAVTGVRVPNIELYRSFGRLRNSVQHFLVPDNISASGATIEYIYQVIDPFINECWGLFAIDHNEDYEPYEYIVDGLVRAGVEFLVSPEMMESIEPDRLEWPASKSYRAEMERRFKKAKADNTTSPSEAD